MKTGDKAPEFELQANDGRTVRLADYRGKKAIVLYFYPKDETTGCTIEACTFRDEYEDFTAAGAEVIGVSDDSVASHDGFAKHHRLPFVLASDPDGKLRDQMGVTKTLGLLPGRVTFVIDKEGVIRDRFSSMIRFKGHVQNALALVKTL
jgi:thioredoxin-dependent peroxiredoxin